MNEAYVQTRAAQTIFVESDPKELWRFPEGLYECEVRLAEEVEGYTVYVPQLPGVVSEGSDLGEALDHIREALAAALEGYRAEDVDVPWDKADKPIGPEELRRWVVVHA